MSGGEGCLYGVGDISLRHSREGGNLGLIVG